MTEAENPPIRLDDAGAQREAARRLWGRLEAIHTVAYFAPEVLDAQAELGLVERTSGYAAARIAPMGPVGPELAVATFYGFAPRLLATALPAAWEVASPEEVLATLQRAVTGVLEGLWTDLDTEVVRAAELARQAALLHPVLGRPLAAAWSSVPWSSSPTLLLWQAATRVRESRGDGHVAVLVDAQLDGPESHLTTRGDSDKLRRILSPRRGFTDAEWDAAADRLRARGLLDDEGRLTPDGEQLRAHVERRTDALAAPAWVAFGAPRTEQLRQALDPLVARVVDSGVLPGVVTRQAAR